MPLFISALIGALVSICASLVGRILVSLSIGYVTYTGVSVGLTALQNWVWSEAAGLPETVLNILGFLQVDTCIDIMLSAYVARITLAGLSAGGSITKMQIKSSS
jgi:hypothetical protein